MKGSHCANWGAIVLGWLALMSPAAAQQATTKPPSAQTSVCTIAALPAGDVSAEDVKLLNDNLRCIQRRLERLEAAGDGSGKKYGMLRTATLDQLIVVLESLRFSEDQSRVISQWTVRNTRQEPMRVMIDPFKSSISVQGDTATKTPVVQDLAACDVAYVDSTEQCARRKPERWSEIRPGSWDPFRIVTANEVRVTEPRPVTFKIRFIVRKGQNDWFFQDVVFDNVPPARKTRPR